jgi:hypothetical protein
MIVNYDPKSFIIQATGWNSKTSSERLKIIFEYGELFQGKVGIFKFTFSWLRASRCGGASMRPISTCTSSTHTTSPRYTRGVT